MSYHRLTTTMLVMTGALIAGLTLVFAAPAVAAPVTSFNMDVLLRVQGEALANAA